MDLSYLMSLVHLIARPIDNGKFGHMDGGYFGNMGRKKYLRWRGRFRKHISPTIIVEGPTLVVCAYFELIPNSMPSDWPFKFLQNTSPQKLVS